MNVPSADRPVATKFSKESLFEASLFVQRQLEAALDGKPFLVQFDIDGTAASYTDSPEDTRFPPSIVKSIKVLQAIAGVTVEINTSGEAGRTVRIQQASGVRVDGHTVKGNRYLSWDGRTPVLTDDAGAEHLRSLYEPVREAIEAQLRPLFAPIDDQLVVEDPDVAASNGLVYYDFKGPETSFQPKGSRELDERVKEIVMATFEAAAAQWLEASRSMPERAELVDRFRSVKFVPNEGNYEINVELQDGWTKSQALQVSLDRIGAQRAVFFGDDTGDLDAFALVDELQRNGMQIMSVGVLNPAEYRVDGSLKRGGPNLEVQRRVSVMVEGQGGMAELITDAVRDLLEVRPTDVRLQKAAALMNLDIKYFVAPASPARETRALL